MDKDRPKLPEIKPRSNNEKFDQYWSPDKGHWMEDKRTSREKYEDYLKSAAWLSRREEVLRFWNYTCSICSKDYDLHVHHRTYVRLGNEWLSDLIVLCAKCHEKFHGELPEVHDGDDDDGIPF